MNDSTSPSSAFRSNVRALIAISFLTYMGGVSAQTAAPSPPKIVQNTQCTAIKMCYCVNDEFLPIIDEKVKTLRAMIAAEKAKGKTIGYFSVPLSTTGGG